MTLPEPRRWTPPARIAMCVDPHGIHEHVPLEPGEKPPEVCFAGECSCKPVVFEVVEARPEPSEAAVERLRVAVSQVGYALVAVREDTPREADRAISLALENLRRAVDAVSGKEGA